MADHENFRSYRTHDPHESGEPAAPGQPASDPLAELARLIGQTDPFAEFERNRLQTARTEEPQRPSEEAEPPHAYQDYEHDLPEDDAAYTHPGATFPPGYAPPYATGTEAPEEADYREELLRRRNNRRLITAAAIIIFGVVGAAGAYGYRTLFALAPSRSAPPVIKADTTPAKIIPAARASDAHNNKLSYDRVGAHDQPEKMVPREEKPVDIRAAEVSPPPATPSPADSAVVQTPPVRTVPVTVNNEAAAGAPNAAGAPRPALGSGIILPSPKRVKTITIRPDMSAAPSQPSERAPVPQVAPPPAVANADAPEPPRSVDEPPQAPTQRAVSRPQEPRQPPQAAAEVPQQRTSPLSLSPQAEPQLAALPSGGYVVQVASQRSEADAKASYKALQAKYPGVLGGRSSTVRRADLGSRGVYFRTLVGPFASAEQAAKLCSALKAAGGQCLIHKN